MGTEQCQSHSKARASQYSGKYTVFQSHSKARAGQYSGKYIITVFQSHSKARASQYSGKYTVFQSHSEFLIFSPWSHSQFSLYTGVDFCPAPHFCTASA